MDGQTRRDVDTALDIIRKHQLKPAADTVYDWNDAKSAFDALRTQSAIGKIVVRV
jgi:NADPH:quinone reductase-like Zn-dependent oxidoreductase